MHAANHRHQMRRKQQTDFFVGQLAQLLDCFRRMPMAGYAVGLEIVAGFRVQHTDFRLAATARYARFAIGDQVRGINHIGLQQRRQAELHGSWIATWIADDARVLDRGAVQLRQAIYGFFQQFGAAVLQLVPLLEHRSVLQAKIGG